MQLDRPVLAFLLAAVMCGYAPAAGKKPKDPDLSPLDRYIKEALEHSGGAQAQASAGSLWAPDSRMTNLGGDIRAAQVDELVTIVVLESASAVAQGATKSQRQSSAKASVTALGGVKSPSGALANLAGASSATQLDGQGATSRNTQLSTRLSARVTHVLPNGYLVVEGNKEVVVNSERQIVTVRGVVRPEDLTTGNLVRSDQIAQLELKINGKGVVGDAVRRPFFLYRLLLGLLPF